MTDTDTIGKDANVASADTDIILQTTNVTPIDFTATETTLCFFPSNPDIVVGPTQIEFGPLLLGESVDEIVVVTNVGKEVIGIGTMSVPPTPFSLQNDDCSKSFLPPGGSCAITIRLSPSSFGNYFEYLNIPFDDPNEGIATLFLSGAGAKIALFSPKDNTSFNACSLISPPTFAWRTEGSYKGYRLGFSSERSLSPDLLKISVAGQAKEVKTSASIWKRLLSTANGRFYSMILAKIDNATGEISNQNAIVVEPPKPAGNPFITDPNRTSLPTLSWVDNCNTKFKVWFGSDQSFTKKTSFAFNIRTPTDSEGRFTKALTPGQWMAIRRMAGDVSGSTIFWYVESWDGLGRYTKTETINFVLGE